MAPRWSSALWLVVCLIGCRDQVERKPAPSAPATQAPVYPEASWDEVARRIESGDVFWIVPATDRRIFVTTKTGAEFVTSAPNDDALGTLVARVDPKRERLVVTRQYEQHQEIRWSHVRSVLAKHKVYTVEQNGGRRVILGTVSDEGTVGPGYITLQPHHGDIDALVPKKHPNGLFVKRFDYREITWPEAKKIMGAHDVSVSLAHVGRVIIRVEGSDERPYLTIEPTTNEASSWIEANKPGSLLTIE